MKHREYSLRIVSFLTCIALGNTFCCGQNLELQQENSIVIAKFNSGNYGDWMATGDAFRLGPARGAEVLARLDLENSPDDALACSELEGDGPQGRLTSPEFTIQRDYIDFRIAGGNYERHTCINLLIDGKIVRSATGWRSDRLNPTSWLVKSWRGKNARIEIVDEYSGEWGHINVDQIVQTNQPETLPIPVAPLYRESLRPQFHITARQWTMNTLNPGMREEGWINDVNGLIYYEGDWHFFAQRWNKCWLHFSSEDLIHWQEHDPAFWEEECNSGVQSGYCVIDYKNTSGLSSNPSIPPMIAFWSRADNKSQCISYSLDQGKTWKHYEGNPILTYRERDPKVFWYEPGKHWVMVLYGDNNYHILNSNNLLDWTDIEQPIRKAFECPDMFEIAVEGEPNEKRWVLVYVDGRYAIGDFNGKEFTPEHEGLYSADVGDFYATQSFHNTDKGAGNRRIQMAWVRFSNFPDMPFSQQITFPCEVMLRRTDEGLRLHRLPISEIEKLHDGKAKWSEVTLHNGETLPLKPNGRHYHIVSELNIPDGAQAIFRIRGIDLVLTRNSMQLGQHHATTQSAITSVEILIDRTSIEVFLNEGEVSCTEFHVFDHDGLSIRAAEHDIELKSVHVYPLKSMWTEGDNSIR